MWGCGDGTFPFINFLAPQNTTSDQPLRHKTSLFLREKYISRCGAGSPLPRSVRRTLKSILIIK
jgi:hypothetical protein